jgi:hypothetical protein
MVLNIDFNPKSIFSLLVEIYGYELLSWCICDRCTWFNHFFIQELCTLSLSAFTILFSNAEEGLSDRGFHVTRLLNLFLWYVAPVFYMNLSCCCWECAISIWFVLGMDLHMTWTIVACLFIRCWLKFWLAVELNSTLAQLFTLQMLNLVMNAGPEIYMSCILYIDSAILYSEFWSLHASPD